MFDRDGQQRGREDVEMEPHVRWELQRGVDRRFQTGVVDERQHVALGAEPEEVVRHLDGRVGVARQELVADRAVVVETEDRHRLAIRQMDDDALAIMNNTPLLAPGEEGLKDTIVVEAIYRAAASGQKEKVG
ncbi:hypothetical protein D3C83_23740 [compost metagenome]